MVVVLFNVQSGEVIRLADTAPGFRTVAECLKALTLLPKSKNNVQYMGWCLTPKDIRV
jgi:hypothetical protein